MARTDIDQSYERLLQIRSLIQERKRNALNASLKEELVVQGFVDRGNDLATARRNIEKRFDELLRRAERYGKLDMCAVFEGLVSTYIRPALGESRKALAASYDFQFFINAKDKFVREPESFESFDSIIRLIADQDRELGAMLSKVRTLRNEISHGRKHLSQDGLSGEVIRDVLNEALTAFGIS